MATYPNNILVKGDVVNEIDPYDAADHNILKDEIIALQTYIGTNPHGDQGSLADRFNAMHNASGYLINSAGTPQPTSVGMIWYDTADDVIKVIPNDKVPVSVGGGQSNTIFAWAGFDNHAADSRQGLSVSNGGSLETTSLCDVYYYNGAEAYFDMIHFKFKKISDISTAIFYARAFRLSNSCAAKIKLTIGSAVGSGVTAVLGRTDPQWYEIVSLDLTGLDNGTAYDCSIAMTSGTNGSEIGMSAVTIIGE